VSVRRVRFDVIGVVSVVLRLFSSASQISRDDAYGVHLFTFH
jgi:hypothetical protein